MTTRVLHIVYAMNAGGIETWLMNIFRMLRAENILFDFVVNSNKPGFYDEEIRVLGGDIYYGGSLRRPDKTFRVVKTLLDRNMYSSVHCHNIENATSALLAAYINGSKSRLLHSHNDFGTKISCSSLFSKIYLKIQRYLSIVLSSELLAVSKAAGFSLFGDSEYQVIPLSIQLDRFIPTEDSSVIRKNLGIAEGMLVVGHVGRFDYQKNQIFIVEISQYLLSSLPETKFVLVGSGELSAKIKQSVVDLGIDKNFIFLGQVGNVPEIMKEIFDVFLFPSHSEGLGLAVVEAQASGLPVICSDVLPVEATVVEELVTRMSLRAHASEWASRLETISRSAAVSKSDALEAVKNSDFNLENSIVRLKRLWNIKK
ncbi:glycosyltransferase [Enterovibrio sp. 27052020O]|uniref:glycosyltransferase n=1 Tax=Enterovibrio sp. 27052020O TaxID=3241166 RepID=UPI00388E9801